MSELPPNIDAILASIRSRMTEDGAAKPEAPAAPAQPVVAEAKAPPAPPAPGIDGGQTLEALARAMLEPMLKAWIDANMPEIVERMAQAEIKRLTGRD